MEEVNRWLWRSVQLKVGEEHTRQVYPLSAGSDSDTGGRNRKRVGGEESGKNQPQKKVKDVDSPARLKAALATSTPANPPALPPSSDQSRTALGGRHQETAPPTAAEGPAMEADTPAPGTPVHSPRRGLQFLKQLLAGVGKPPEEATGTPVTGSPRLQVMLQQMQKLADEAVLSDPATPVRDEWPNGNAEGQLVATLADLVDNLLPPETPPPVGAGTEENPILVPPPVERSPVHPFVTPAGSIIMNPTGYVPFEGIQKITPLTTATMTTATTTTISGQDAASQVGRRVRLVDLPVAPPEESDLSDSTFRSSGGPPTGRRPHRDTEYPHRPASHIRGRLPRRRVCITCSL